MLYATYLRSRVRRGRGIGMGSEYVPWLRHRDVPSKGTTSTIRGIKVERPHHLLSGLEASYFYLIERMPSVVDIREQWPILDLAKTFRICAELGVSHAYKGDFPEPFSIDFLITERDGEKLKYRAASIKSPCDAKDPKIRQRLAVEFEWCKENGIDWVLIDTSRFDQTLLETLRFIRSWFRFQFVPDDTVADHFANAFIIRHRPSLLLKEILAECGKLMALSASQSQDLFCYCAWSSRIPVDIRHKLALNLPVVIADT